MMILNWLEERLGAGEAVGKIMHKPLRGGARYCFSLGFVNLFLVVNQILTGIFLMMYYVPSPDHAYDSVKFIQNEAAMGNIVRGLHFWGASAMVVFLFLHVLRVYLWGAYKKPRELMWLTGATLFFLVFGFAFTGYLLPWDQKSYWATVVGTNVAGTAPVAGPIMLRVLRGGAEITALTLTRFFAIHTMVLPWTLAAVAGAHMTILQFVDHTPPWDPDRAKVTAPFYPDQVFKDMVVALAVFTGLMLLANLAPAQLEAVADPSDKSYIPRPEWYFYFLFQLLHYFEGRMEVVGTMVLPNLFIVVVMLLPFIDRSPERNPAKRPVAMAAIGMVLVGYVALTGIAAFEGRPVAPTKAATEGRKLYGQLGCGSCHAINGVGGKVGPPLDHISARRDRQWLMMHFKDPQRMSPGSVMPKYDYLSQQQLDSLTDYMQGMK